MKSKSNIERQRGAITLVETLGVLIIASLIMPTVWGWLSDDADSKVNRATADHDKQVVLAAGQYIKDNYAAVLANASATTPATITVPMLQSQYPQMFATGFSVKNPYGQTVTAQAYQPTAGTLDTIIVTSGGQTISEGNMRKIAQLIGGAGGYISSTNPSVANGSYGAWGPKTIPNSPGGGHMVYSLMFENGSMVTDYLYRKAVPGHPELTNMQTDLGMTDTSGTPHNVTGANLISSQSLQALSNGSVGAPSVSLANGKVISFNQVPEGGVLGLVGANGQPIYLESLNGTFRLVNGPWNAQLFSVDQSGNVNASGNLTANGQITTNSNVYLAQNGTSVLGGGQLQVNANGPLYLNPWSGGQTIVGGGGGSGNLQVTGNVDGDGYIRAGQIASTGARCGPNGSFGNDGRQALFCNDGVWTAVGESQAWRCVQYWSVWASGILQDHYFSVFNSTSDVSYGSEGNGWMAVCRLS
ncbi:shufflon system plasmid conjugative transfer pilus tip adhesin PilV [Burkholderia sp. B21-005]|uniref:shufflon system plasmid conjugative transfer pilus tip adhesin PilV n=1 Tax=Burkholderia sp. B21-005 TaxID=2890406 RepID=UPI001E568E5B|nr:shufflon system plasmid conjugative transfer pilus tip adhesin PilV [Burkholderia sp. B21-005]UEP40681.1 shufflon system plasmid conjugative transfer pilus tip adhesin PilV [Burkholderia sp. B21-005]